MNGTGVHRALLYLEKILNVPIPRPSPEWNDLTNLIELRNIVVHAVDMPGSIDSKGPLAKYIREHPELIQRSQTGQLDIATAYCRKLLESVMRFFDNLMAWRSSNRTRPAT
jgi:hypothetical protein